MFARVAALLPFALLASASYLAARDQDNSCNGGTQACCDQAFSQQTPDIAGANFINLVANAVLAAGVSCSGISVQTCNQQNLCCTNDGAEGGLVTVSCNNINGV